jgi:ABC-type sugar transport system permease subunit
MSLLYQAKVFSRSIYLFAVPAFILYTMFWVTPVLLSFGYSLTNWNGVGNSARYIGLKNYSRLFSDGSLVNLIKNTLLYALFTIILDNVIGLIVALILDRPSKLTRFFRTVFYLSTL